jgi:hypothetical protein
MDPTRGCSREGQTSCFERRGLKELSVRCSQAVPGPLSSPSFSTLKNAKIDLWRQGAHLPQLFAVGPRPAQREVRGRDDPVGVRVADEVVVAPARVHLDLRHKGLR